MTNNSNTIMSPILIDEVYSRLKGYSPVYRQDTLLIKIGLTDGEFVLYRTINDSIADWDPRHAKYGTFVRDFEKTAFALGWEVSKTRRLFDKLWAYGFYFCIDSRRMIFKIVGYELQREHRQSLTSGGHVFQYLDALLECIKKSNETNQKSNNSFTTLLQRYEALKHDFPKMKDRPTKQIDTKAPYTPKSRFNTGASNGEYSSEVNYEFTEEDERIIDDIFANKAV